MANTPLSGSPSNIAVGYYSATYTPPGGSATALGLVKDVTRFRQEYAAQPIQADKYGDSLIDGVYRGANFYLYMVFLEWKTITKQVLWPFGTNWGDGGVRGRLLSSLAGQLVLTAQNSSGLTAYQTTGPRTLTAPYAILAPQQSTEVLFGNLTRDVPVLFQLLPYNDGTNDLHFTLTEPS